ncbi:MAG: tetratricopeptide repeat protein [Planctomycetota bacterium]|jgi:tetratricopeptide (TPR) repeat protein
MQARNHRGIEFGTGSADALERYDAALTLFHGYYGDPLAVIDEALSAEPGFVSGWVFRAGVLATTSDARDLPALRDAVARGEALATAATDRERRHLAAARAWLDGDLTRAVNHWGDCLLRYPQDALAAQLAHLGDFYLGQQRTLHERIAQVLPRFDSSHPSYSYLLGMLAFGLEERNRFEEAKTAGQQALALNPRDPWAIHAIAHVYEMQGRLEQGVEFLRARTDDWSINNLFAPHNWWHLALYHLDLGEMDAALTLYDRHLWPDRERAVLDLIDASSLLWRIYLRGGDVCGRVGSLAEAWEARIDDGYYAFNDAHAMMALAADGRYRAAERLLRRLEAAAAEDDTNGRLTRAVGLPVARALYAFETGDYDTAVARLLPIRNCAHQFGGSNAQRDVLDVTLAEAALRAGHSRLATALANERTTAKPGSPFNWALAARAEALAGVQHGLDRAHAARSDAPRAVAPTLSTNCA